MIGADGSGPRLRVALLHGWGGSFNDTFKRNGWVEALSGIGREVVPLDLPGHGKPPLSHCRAAYADLAGSVLAMLPDEPLDLIGFSLGGKLALAIAERAPARVGRVIVGGVGDNLFAPEPVSSGVVHWLSAADRSNAPGDLKAVIDRVIAEGRDPLALAAVIGRTPNPVFRETSLRRLRHAVTLIVGDRDTVAGPPERLSAVLPQVHVGTLDDVGHFDMPASAQFRRAACDALAGRDLATNEASIGELL